MCPMTDEHGPKVEGQVWCTSYQGRCLADANELAHFLRQLADLRPQQAAGLVEAARVAEECVRLIHKAGY